MCSFVAMYYSFQNPTRGIVSFNSLLFSFSLALLLVLLNILPMQFCHLWINAYLPLFPPLPKNLHIATLQVHILNTQNCKLIHTHTSIKQKQKYHIITKSNIITRVTSSKHFFNVL